MNGADLALPSRTSTPAPTCGSPGAVQATETVDVRTLSMERLTQLERSRPMLDRFEQAAPSQAPSLWRQQRVLIAAASSEVDRRQRLNMLSSLRMMGENIAIMAVTAASVVAVMPPISNVVGFGLFAGLAIIDCFVSNRVHAPQGPAERRHASFWLHVLTGAGIGVAAVTFPASTVLVSAVVTLLVTLAVVSAVVFAPRWALQENEKPLQTAVYCTLGLQIVELVASKCAIPLGPVLWAQPMLAVLVGLSDMPFAARNFADTTRSEEFNRYAAAAALTAAMGRLFLGVGYGYHQIKEVKALRTQRSKRSAF